MPQRDEPRDSNSRDRLVAELRRECEAAVEARADRYLRAEHHGIIPGAPFAPASAECIDLFRDGHFFGAISLSQAVGEAIVRHMCDSNRCSAAAKFERNVLRLRTRGFVNDDIKRQLLKLWEKRNDYHHLNNNVETDRITLEQLAFTKIRALATIEGWVFKYSFAKGALVVRFPQYWPRTGADRVAVFLRRPTV
jgi:hypothetical protein